MFRLTNVEFGPMLIQRIYIFCRTTTGLYLHYLSLILLIYCRVPFQTHMSWSFVFSELWWEMNVRLGDIVDHHCLNIFSSSITNVICNDLQIEINYFLAVGDKLFIVLQREAGSTLSIFMIQQDYKQHM